MHRKMPTLQKEMQASSTPDFRYFTCLLDRGHINIERFFSYEWNGKLYENILDTKSREFKKNRYVKSGVELKADFLEYLEDNEIDLVSKAKGIL